MEDIKIKELNRLKEILIDNFKNVEIDVLDKESLKIKIEKDSLILLINYLLNQENYIHLSMMSYVDWPEKKKIELIYILHSYENGTNTIISIFLDREKPEFVTLKNIFAQAETYEIEFNEMIGIDFKGNNRMGEEFLLEGWDGPPPMRRDFDTLDYVNDNYEFRAGREDAIDVREFIKNMKHEKGGLDD